MGRDRGDMYHYLPPRRLVVQLRAQYVSTFPLQHENGVRKNLIWLSRGGQDMRQLSGETELVHRTQSLWEGGIRNASVVVLGRDFPSVVEVGRLLFSAFSVVGVHGAGLGNIIFGGASNAAEVWEVLRTYCSCDWPQLLVCALARAK